MVNKLDITMVLVLRYKNFLGGTKCIWITRWQGNVTYQHPVAFFFFFSLLFVLKLFKSCFCLVNFQVDYPHVISVFGLQKCYKKSFGTGWMSLVNGRVNCLITISSSSIPQAVTVRNAQLYLGGGFGLC